MYISGRRAMCAMWVLGAVVASAACSRSRAATSPAEPARRSAADAPAGAGAPPCAGHAACADHFFVDAVPPDGCADGASCTMAWTIVPTGEFHLNDDYPYRFKAEGGAGLDFEGHDPAGTNVFSKSAGDWRRSGAKSGTLAVRFTPSGRGPKTVSGVLKVSVCSVDTCVLDQPRVSASFGVN